MKEIIKEFIDVDGHIDYLQKIEEGQKIAMVLGYPGDNPVGGLFEITVHSSGKQSAKRFATISDGDILCDGKAE